MRITSLVPRLHHSEMQTLKSIFAFQGSLGTRLENYCTRYSVALSPSPSVFCILQAIKNWRWKPSGNEAKI